MKKKHLLMLAAFLLPYIAFAQLRSEGDAVSVAQHFWGTGRAKLKAVAQAKIAKAKTRISSASPIDSYHPAYYIVNDEERDRFVIVSGDERLYKILGYSNNGVFNADTAPEGLLEMLNEYDGQYQNVAPYLDEIGNTGARKAIAPVEPMIKTRWHQESPFNVDCPIDIASSEGKKSIVGCVATAMAQVMNYYKYPECGIGSNKYTTTTRNMNIDMDFSAVRPDWNNMLNVYNEQANDSQKAAVAKLSYACGVSVSMDYTEISSGAYAKDMAYALSKFWKFNKNISYKSKKYYADEEWNQIIQQELSEGHPILYAGNSWLLGGHQFVLDGCDSEGLYHFNFGWKEDSEGYYRLDLIGPNIFYDFSSEQSMVCFVTPETYGQPSREFYAEGNLGLSKVKVGSTETFRTTIYNCAKGTVSLSCNESFSGETGVAIFDKDFNFVKSLSKNSEPSLGYGSGWNRTHYLYFDEKTFKEGAQYYLARYAYSEEFGYCIARTEKGREDYYLVTVKDGVITFEPMKKMDDTGTVAIEIVTGLYNASTSEKAEGIVTWQIDLWQDELDKTKFWIANLDPMAEKKGYSYNVGWNKVYGYVANNSNRIDIPVGQTIGENLLLHNYSGGDNIALYLNANAKTMSIEDVWGCVEQDYSSENALINDYSRYSGARFANTTVRGEEPTETNVLAPLINVSRSHIMTLRSNTEGASVYYTLDGSQPSSSSILYSQPVELTGNCTINAMAIKDNSISSVVTYTVSDFACLEPIISQSEGDNIVTITCGTANAEIYYTLDGTVPNKNTQHYIAGFDIEKSCIVKAIAVKQYYNDSPIASKSVLYHQSGESGEQEVWIENNKAGELANRVTEADKNSAQRWYISGKINGTDIRYLKEVFKLGKITDLDLSDAFIVSGGDAYKNSLSEYHTEDNVVGQYMFENARSLISLQLPGTITRIEDFSFDGCDNLASIIVPDLCTELESFALSGCKHISSIHLGRELALFGKYNGNRCPLLISITVNPENIHFRSVNGVLFDTGMTKLVKYPCGKSEKEYIIPSSIKTIGAQAFNGALLENVVMPDGLEVIENGAFAGCKNLLAADMPQSVNIIESSAFSNCVKLPHVSIPDNVKMLNSFSFAYCVNLRKVYIGKSVEDIDGYAFSNATSLQAFSVSNDNLNYIVNDGILYSKDKTTLVRCPLALYSEELILNKDIVSIASHAFANCTYIKKFRLPMGLKSIGNSAFEKCNMESISVPATVMEIDDYAFQNCDSLRSFVIPERLKKLSSFMLAYCDNLEYVYIPANTTHLGTYTFSGNKKLKTIECAVSDISNVEVLFSNFSEEYTPFHNIAANCFWHVPTGCSEAYISQPWWMTTWQINDDVKTGICQTEQNNRLTITSGTGLLTLQSDTNRFVMIHDIRGVVLRRINVLSGRTQAVNLPSGIYIINGCKYYVK